MTAAVTVAVRVGADPLTTFEVFTRDIASWWCRDPRYQFMSGGKGFLRFEPGVGGRLLEETAEGCYVVGEVYCWEPGIALGFQWQGPNFEKHQKTRVFITFHPDAAGTRVVLEHSGWENLPQDHPVRHGLPEMRFMQVQGQWWRQLLKAAASHASGERGHQA